MPGFIGMPELIVLGIVLLLIFGPKRLPEMGRSMGHGLREFKDSISGDRKDDEPDVTTVPVVATVPVREERAA
jgi:sec-independent protein translocase protein TatA